MALAKKLASLSLAIMACGAGLYGKATPIHEKFTIECTFNETPVQFLGGGVYGQGTYVTKDNQGNVIDPGYFTMIEKQPSSHDDWTRKSTYILCGSHGITTALYTGNLSRKETITFKDRRGIYRNWSESKHFTTFWPLDANSFSIDVRVRLEK